MQPLKFVLSIVISIISVACQTDTGKQNGITTNNKEEKILLPAGVLSVAKPLISGELYSKPDFSSASLLHFDTTQKVFLLDTTDAMFMKARINRSATSYTGYISKAILPEQL